MRVHSKALVSTAAIALSASMLMPTVALAQDGPDEADEENRIVVTGTLIRGVEETGSKSIDVGAEEIVALGSSTTNELLGEIPQATNLFNARFDGDPRSADRQQVSRPNLRGLPGINAATGSTTLVLVDGHRVVPMGVDQASFDPDFIPPGAIEKVEVVLDGGSSLYGADAVGGVVNFITRREVDGIEANATLELGDDYEAYNLGLSAGTAWNNGSAYVTYNYYDRGILLRGDRDFAAQGSWNADGTVLTPSGTQCLEPVGEIVTWANFGAGWTSNPAAAALGVRRTAVGTPCDIDAEGTFLPALERHTVLFGLSQELSDTLTLDVRANFGDSHVTFAAYPLGDTVSEQDPNTLMIPGNFGDTYDVASVGFSYGANSAYVDRDQTQDLRVYGIAPELTISLGNDWQIKNLLYWGRSENSRLLPSSNRTVLLDYVASGDFDPTDVAAASPGVINDILNFEVAGESRQELALFRSIADGPIFDLPAGPVRAAFGVELNLEEASLRSESVTIGGLSAIPFRSEARNVKSVFSELSIPVFSMLDLSLSARYDDYSDFGDTFNPSVGFNFEPTEWLRVFGHWGESFNAPTALDAVRTANARFIANAAAGVPDPNMERTDPNRDDVLLVEGSGGGLRPQTAETWSIGTEFEPVSDLVFSANYYNIDFSNVLGAVNPQLASVVLLNPDKFIFNPTQAEFDAFLAASSNGEQFADINADDVGVIIDRRVANISSAQLEGLDFSVDFRTELGAGDLNLGLAGNKQLDFVVTDNGITVDQLEFDLPDLALTAYAGYSLGGFRSRLSLNHTSGFDTNTAVAQTEVDSFTVFNLFLGYEFQEEDGLLEGLAFRFNVDNLFDTDPPVFRQQRNLNYSGFTLGRVFKIGVSKRF
ncbi:TonB-dependent receptor domain-containing protein [Erythrobacter alti]|uniref:TonB-dependent receptor domain-containing protein n=1 Tax=Erythrobacter alti TaxID=1896145 RepID=UPI0030F45781